MRTLILMFFLLLAAPIAHGQGFVSGTVLAPSGVGLPGCNLDFYFAGTGNKQGSVSGDFTGAGGTFLTTVPAGTYDLIVWPPPAYPARPAWVFGVVVTTAVVTNVGTIQLDPAHLLSGTVTNTMGFPVAGVNIDVENTDTGEDILINGDTTGPTGTFTIAVPQGMKLDVLFKSPVSIPLLAPAARFDLRPCVNTNLGTIALVPGFTLSATVLGNGFALMDADLDVRLAGTNQKIFTPGDNSNAFGFVDVVVPAGTYDVEIDPPLGSPLIAQAMTNVVVAGNLPLGTINLVTGFTLSGTVTGPGGVPIAGADLDVEIAGTGIELPTPNDDTNALGQFQVFVPAGIYDLDFDPASFSPFQGAEFLNVFVGGNMTQNAMLAASGCVTPSHYGTGTPGTGGFAPTLETNDFARVGSEFRVGLVNARGGSFGFLAVGLAPTSIPLLGGTLLVSPIPFVLTFNASLSGPATVPCVGQASFAFPIPAVPALVGGTVYLQGLLLDPAGPIGFAWTDGLQVTVCQ